MIEVKHLTKKYGNHIAVNDLSFTANEGQIFGFLGPNGAGKSTTMNMLTGYLAPSDGEILIDGFNILKESEQAKKCIGYLPEIPPVYDSMTVEEYLKFTYELKKLNKKERKEHIEEIIEKTKLQDVRTRLIQNLSKGYKQRVGLAQAIMGYPPIIILDEPTVGLDPAQIIEIRQLIKELGKEHLVILSSHILTEISEVCDHIMIISKGKMVLSGTIDEMNAQMNADTTLSITCRANENHLKEVLDIFINSLKIPVSLTVNPKEEGFCEALLTYSSDEELRENLFFILANNKIPLYEMKLDQKSLEDVFLELTSQNEVEDVDDADSSAVAVDADDTADAANVTSAEEHSQEENTEEESC